MPVVVTGDFNIDVSKEEHTEFISFMKEYLCMDFAAHLDGDL